MSRNRHLVAAGSVHARQDKRLVVPTPPHVGECGGVGGGGAIRRSRLPPDEEVLVLGMARIVMYHQAERSVVVVYQMHHRRCLHLRCLVKHGIIVTTVGGRREY